MRRKLLRGRFPDPLLLVFMLLFEHHLIPAEGAFPGIVTKAGIHFFLQEAYARQPLQAVPAFCASHLGFSLPRFALHAWTAINTYR